VPAEQGQSIEGETGIIRYISRYDQHRYRIGRQRRCDQVIETLHDLRAGEGLRDEGGGRETIELLWRDGERVHRVDDRLAFPALG
jgi:hypothetical protein